MESVNLNYKELNKYNLIVLLTDHDYLNYSLIKKNSKLVIDTRGRLSGQNIFRM